MYLSVTRRPAPAVNNTMMELEGGGDQTVTSTTPTYVMTDSPVSSPMIQQTHPLTRDEDTPRVLKLSNPEYYTRPPVNELEEKLDTNESSCIVKDFVVGRTGYGEILFRGDTDVKGLNIDELGRY